MNALNRQISEHFEGIEWIHFNACYQFCLYVQYFHVTYSIKFIFFLILIGIRLNKQKFMERNVRPMNLKKLFCVNLSVKKKIFSHRQILPRRFSLDTRMPMQNALKSSDGNYYEKYNPNS